MNLIINDKDVFNNDKVEELKHKVGISSKNMGSSNSWKSVDLQKRQNEMKNEKLYTDDNSYIKSLEENDSGNNLSSSCNSNSSFHEKNKLFKQ